MKPQIAQESASICSITPHKECLLRVKQSCNKNNNVKHSFGCEIWLFHFGCEIL